MCIRKCHAAKIEPGGTPTNTGDQLEHWRLKVHFKVQDNF